MVETALGFLKLVDEYIHTLGWLVGDPNSMTDRIEQSTRVFIDSDSQRFFTFGNSKNLRARVNLGDQSTNRNFKMKRI